RSLALATTSKTWVMANDYVGLDEVLDNFSIYDDIVFVAIINMDGKILSHSDRELVGKYIADTERILFLEQMLKPTKVHNREDKVLLENEEFIDIIRVIHHNDSHIGMVHIRLDQKHRQETISSTIFRGVVFTILSVVIGVFFAYFVVNGLIKQLLKLTLTMKKLRSGKRDVKADESGLQEISELSHEFNDLIETLHTSEELTEQLRERLELAFAGTKDGLWDWNIKDDTIYFSPLWKAMLGYKDSELENSVLNWKERVHPDDVEEALGDLQKHIDGKTDLYVNIHRLKHKDGYWIWTLDRAKALCDEDGNATRMVGTHTDITKDKKMQLQYEQQAQVIEQVNDSVISTDLEGNIVSWNKGSERMLGYKAEEVIGKPMSIIHRPEDIEQNRAYTKQLLISGAFSVDAYLVSKFKSIIAVMISLSILRDENGNPIGLIGVSQDITKRKKAEEDLREQKQILEHQAHHDALTGLPNRILFNDRLKIGIEESKRDKTELALLFIDLDHFKEINDSFGHVTGDLLLKEVTERLRNILRDEDTLARLGGDEFTIIIKNLHLGQDASILAQKILSILAEPIVIDEHELYVSSSIGISLCPSDGDSVEDLLKYADAAMYKAKDEGRNNFQFYSAEMTELAFERVVVETSLRTSLENEDFIVYYQPQVDGETDKLIGMEALVRWQHRTMGLVSPAKFIPIAESTGLIVEIDRFVMRSAMEQFAKWYKEGLNPGVLAMNLSVQQLRQKDFIPMFTSLIQETECKPEWLELEVTESQLMTNPEEAIKVLNQINEIGVNLAIDDFGTGYSSLSYLKKFPINKLKIDQSFIRDLPDDEEDVGITNAVIALAKSLNLNIIAEGVETIEQRDFLVENGCRNIQGYFYEKPIPTDDMKRVLLEGLTS
ncbi:MAG: EAL domain-containing protein, partial [Campylobacterota bacterium]|nr:EAL domain-containing protein [Campylobacterota bacterium]